MIANFELTEEMKQHFESVMKNIHQKTKDGVLQGKGPFYAEIYDGNGNFVLGTSNSVMDDQCATKHAEMNAINKACEHYGSFDLSSHNLTLYVNAEPCIMCLGGIMWSGIKQVCFGVKSSDVEKLTGFDEGFKPHWFDEFKKRGIKVCGEICTEEGKEVLDFYVKSGRHVYKPER